MSTKEFSMIYVFKTSVTNKKQVRLLSPMLNDLLQPAGWNFDLQDCDHILRVDSDEDMVSAITALLNNYQFNCEEL